MEFDLDDFMFEVTEALQYTSAHSPTFKHSHSRETTNKEPQVLSSLSVSSQETTHPPSKRARLSSGSQSAREDSSHRTKSISFDNDDPGFEFEGGNRDHVPDFLHPSLDMSTALVSARPRLPPSLSSDRLELRNCDSVDINLISTERLDLVPKFYAYSVKSCLLPLRRVQHELVTLYFHHVHPMFPVVDEYHITELHRKYYGQEEVMDPSEFIIYHATMVFGFAHLSEAQVRNTPYRSVPEGQEAQVDQLKARYWSQTTTDPVALTQISLLLSLWSPGWIGAQNNSYWLDMAFKHAAAKRLWEYEPDQNSRLRLLWWCCLVRDRVLALGMRRPHRLHRAIIEDDNISESDFGVEAKYPSYTDLKSKQVEILAFIWFCRLSRIMETIAIVQRQNRFVRDWNGDSGANIISELEEVSTLHEELNTWLEEFEVAVSETIEDEKYVSDDNVPIHISTLRIMVHSLGATLYQPYLHLPVDYPTLVKSGVDPLKKMKDGARAVATHVRGVMGNKKSDAIPTWLVAWVTLPVAVYHVDQCIRLNSSPDKVLMPFLAQLVRRTSGALMLLMLVRSATKDHIETITNGGDTIDTAIAGPMKGGSSFRFVHSTLSQNVVTRSTEARLLAFVMRAIDSALELNGMV